ncbi:RNA-binding S4 domain-containing protein [Defluviicoccus vanus]|uniref:RNA-binding S4 domain-containing protein n=1 Tax=Defluviicoccus vanus TaxID=111831 RepID=A0A7H1MXU0_9PROT|nr:RNA-binding S4 domain-containing protein [Defluviicoccus vanus]QNT68276.1 RNA-binding S4 domain-containing protein [Defluviicoccus vanus]
MSDETTRLDKWLWFARFFKTRTRSTAVCEDGHVRVNGTRVQKAHHLVRPGDVLTFAQERQIRVVRILALANRRGPAAEAQQLYQDLTPVTADAESDISCMAATVARPPGHGRPTKADRRAIDRLREGR